MRLKKRIIMIVLVLAVISGTMAVGAGVSASSIRKGTTFTSGSLKYQITSLKKKQGTVMVIGGKSQNISSAVIPQTVKKGKYSLTVTAVGQKAFAGCKKLRRITVKSKSLTKVGNKAFTGVKNIVLEVPKSRLYVYESLFEGKGCKSGLSMQTIGNSAAETDYNAVSPVVLNNVSAVDAAVSAALSGEDVSRKAASIEKQVSKTQEPKTEAPKTEPPVTKTEVPATKVPATKAPATKAPVVKAPATETPVIETEAPATEIPVTKAPVVETPATETPVIETEVPATEAPATEAPVIEAPHEHSYTWTVSAAKCTENGESVGICSCGYTVSVVIPMTGHTIILHDAIPETCTAAGQTAYKTCSLCDYATKPQVILPHSHSFNGWQTIKEATCYTTGKEIRVCEECGFTETKIISDGHKLEPYPEKDRDATCTQRGEKHSHCIICGQDFFHYTDKPVGHDYQEVKEEATCTKNGAEYKKCTRCGDVIDKVTFPKLGHQWGGVIPAEVTCTEGGYSTHRCERCGVVDNVYYVQPHGHKYTCYHYNGDATCTKRGTESSECIYCGETHTRYTSIVAVGHDYIHHAEVPATCSKAGMTEYSACSRCGAYENGIAPEIIPAKEHTWSDIIIRDSVCLGYVKYRECTECKARDILESRPGKGHNWVEYTNSEGEQRLRCGNEGCKRYQPYTNAEFNIHMETGKYKDAVRVVWGVIYEADMKYCKGFTDYRGVKTSMIWPTAIPADVVFEVKAPEPKEGYKFVKWIDVRTGETVSTDMTRHDDWRNMDRVFRAVYEPVNN